MRTTIDIPDQDHALFKALAQQRGKTLGEMLIELARSGLQPGVREPAGDYRINIDAKTGLPILSGGSRVITPEEVKKFLDDEA